MKILALEFSSPQRSVAVLRSPEMEVCETVETGSGATRALAMVDESLRQAKLEREQLDGIVVGLGPGSYTGIRAAIALAQGWQLAREINLLGISSVECLAVQAGMEGVIGRINCVIDAQREEFYLATYDIVPNAPGLESSGRPLSGLASVQGMTVGWREVEPLRLVSLADLRRRAQAGELLIGPEVTDQFPAGRPVFPRAGTLARLALRRNNFVSGEQLEPIYLRKTNFLKAPPSPLQF